MKFYFLIPLIAFLGCKPKPQAGSVVQDQGEQKTPAHKDSGAKASVFGPELNKSMPDGKNYFDAYIGGSYLERYTESNPTKIDAEEFVQGFENYVRELQAVGASDGKIGYIVYGDSLAAQPTPDPAYPRVVVAANTTRGWESYGITTYTGTPFKNIASGLTINPEIEFIIPGVNRFELGVWTPGHAASLRGTCVSCHADGAGFASRKGSSVDTKIREAVFAARNGPNGGFRVTADDAANLEAIMQGVKESHEIIKTFNSCDGETLAKAAAALEKDFGEVKKRLLALAKEKADSFRSQAAIALVIQQRLRPLSSEPYVSCLALSHFDLKVIAQAKTPSEATTSPTIAAAIAQPHDTWSGRLALLQALGAPADYLKVLRSPMQGKVLEEESYNTALEAGAAAKDPKDWLGAAVVFDKYCGTCHLYTARWGGEPIYSLSHYLRNEKANWDKSKFDKVFDGNVTTTMSKVAVNWKPSTPTLDLMPGSYHRSGSGTVPMPLPSFNQLLVNSGREQKTLEAEYNPHAAAFKYREAKRR